MSSSKPFRAFAQIVRRRAPVQTGSVVEPVQVCPLCARTGRPPSGIGNESECFSYLLQRHCALFDLTVWVGSITDRRGTLVMATQ